MKTRRHKKRPRSFSPAFDAWLRWCEHYEDFEAGRRNTFPDLVYHEDFFVIDDLSQGIDQLVHTFVKNAKGLRSALKFRFQHPALVEHGSADHYDGGQFTLNDVWSETPIAAPFPLTYVEVDITTASRGDARVMFLLEERYADKVEPQFKKQYDALGIAPGDMFLCIHTASCCRSSGMWVAYTRSASRALETHSGATPSPSKSTSSAYSAASRASGDMSK